MSLNWTHHHLVKNIIKFFEQMDNEQPGEGWGCKADSQISIKEKEKNNG